MKRLISILLFTLTLTLVSYKGDQDLETEKYLNFLASIENGSTFNYFTVIKVKDLNTGVTKEICTKGNFVAGAIHIELKANYEDKGQQNVLLFAKKNKDRYFEFKNRKALDNISFFDYNTKLVSKIQTEYDFAKTVAFIKKHKKFCLRLSDEKMKAFAHVLFNKGIMTGESSCWGGALEYADRSNRDR